MAYRLDWHPQALDDFKKLAEQAPVQAKLVLENMEWMTQIGMSLGRPAPRTRVRDLRYWPVSKTPQGVYYYVRGGYLIIRRIKDARRRRTSWP